MFNTRNGYGRKRTRTQALIEGGIRGLFADGGDGGDGTGGAGGAGGSGDGGDGGGSSDGGDGDGADLAAKLQQLQDENARLKAHAEEVLTQRKKDRQKAEDLARKAGDLEALEASWQEKYAQAEQTIGGLRSHVETITSGMEASRIASEMAVKGSEELLKSWVAPRLKTVFDEDGGPPKVVVLDKAGKPSALTVEDLKTELKKEPALAPILVASKATGAGGSPPNAGGAGGKNVARDEWAKMTPAQKSKAVKDNPNLKIV